MLFRHIIQYLRHLVQRISKLIHRRHWICFLLRQLIFLHQRLFSPDPPSKAQVHGPQRQFYTHSTLRSVGQSGKNGVVLMSCIPAISTSNSDKVLGPASPSDTPYTVENEDLAQSSPRASVRNVSQDKIRNDQAHDPVHYGDPYLQACAPSTGRDVGTRGTFRFFNSVASYGRGVGTHGTFRSSGSVASSGRAPSYRRHEGPTSHVRFPHRYDIHSIATCHTSSSPHRVAHSGGIVTSTSSNNEPGDPTAYPRFAQMTSGDVRRYKKNYST